MSNDEIIQVLRDDLTSAFEAYKEAMFDPTQNESMWEEFDSSKQVIEACKSAMAKKSYTDIETLIADVKKSLEADDKKSAEADDMDFDVLRDDLNSAFEAYKDAIFDLSQNESMWEEFDSSKKVQDLCKKVLASKKFTSVDSLMKAVIKEFEASKPKPVPAYASRDIGNYTRFEKARMVGARALQIAMGAPVLVDYPEDMLDPIDIAMLEFDAGIIPISVVRN